MRGWARYLADVFKSFVSCIEEASRQAREYGELPEKCISGSREMKETGFDPSLFYTEICPEGIYLTGVVEADGYGNLKEVTDPGKRMPGIDGFGAPESDQWAGAGTTGPAMIR